MSVGGVRKTDFKDKMLCLRPSYRFLPLMCQDQSVLRALGPVMIKLKRMKTYLDRETKAGKKDGGFGWI
ncbi:hypothetical protein F2Q69_00035248 [Brassica cretica]|uniref:Uncharacterized protein n=1 Tax=Brassica cretica TaxID=69181 RepID=A0A8S9SNS0_BRACR|nr:hypothetical protein F2Q69_00035248 [Brassica cretica]